MIAKINQLLQEVEALKAANAEELEALRIKYLSKKGAINDLMADFRNVAAEQKKEVGMRLNELKNKAQEKIAALKEQFESQDTGILPLQLSVQSIRQQHKYLNLSFPAAVHRLLSYALWELSYRWASDNRRKSGFQPYNKWLHYHIRLPNHRADSQKNGLYAW